jgi:integrase/recombinase XerD
MFRVGQAPGFRAFEVAPKSDHAYWTVVDDDFRPVPLADEYLRDLRLARDRAVSTSKAYAENLSLFFEWLVRSGIAVEDGPRQLGRFMHLLKTLRRRL